MKKIIVILLTLAMAFCLFACGGKSSGGTSTAPAASSGSSAPASSGSSSAAPVANDKVYKAVCASSYDVKSPQVIATQKFCDEVKEATDGHLVIEMFPNSALASEKDAYIQQAANEIEFTMQGCLLLDMYAPDYGFFNSPFLFDSYDHVEKIWDSDLGDGLKAELNSNNIHLLAIGSRGPRVLSANVEVKTPADIKGVKLRLPETAAWVEMWGPKYIGASTMSVALAELYTSLQTGVCNASDGPYEQMATYKLNEVQSYVIDTNHIWEWIGLFVSDEFYNELPAEYQQIVDQKAQECINVYASKACADAASGFLQDLINGGMTEVTPDIAAFREAAKPGYDDWFKNTWTSSNYDEVMSFGN